MKHSIIAAMTLAALFLSLSTANAETHRFNYSGFDRISVKITEERTSTTFFGWNVSVGNRIDCTPVINIVRSDEYGVEMNINNDEYANICNVRLSGKELQVEVTFDKKAGKAKLDIEFTICTPALSELNAHGNCTVNSDGSFETAGDFSLRMSGASDLNKLNVSAKNATLRLSGASDVNNIDITADKNIEFTISGASDLSGARLRADYLEFITSGASGVNAEADIREGVFKVSGASSASVSSLSKDAVAENVDISVSGASRGGFSSLYSKNTTARVSGSSTATAYASDNLYYSADMTSSFNYYGKPANINSR